MKSPLHELLRFYTAPVLSVNPFHVFNFLQFRCCFVPPLHVEELAGPLACTSFGSSGSIGRLSHSPKDQSTNGRDCATQSSKTSARRQLFKKRKQSGTFVPMRLLTKDIPIWELPTFQKDRTKNDALEYLVIPAGSSESAVATLSQGDQWSSMVLYPSGTKDTETLHTRMKELVEVLRSEMPQMPYQHSIKLETLSAVSHDAVPLQSNNSIGDMLVRRLHKTCCQMSPNDFLSFVKILAKRPYQTRQRDLFLIISQAYRKSDYFSNEQVLDLIQALGDCCDAIGLTSLTLSEEECRQADLLWCVEVDQDSNSQQQETSPHHASLIRQESRYSSPNDNVDLSENSFAWMRSNRDHNLNPKRSYATTDYSNQSLLYSGPVSSIEYDDDSIWDFVLLSSNQWKTGVRRLLDRLLFSRLSTKDNIYSLPTGRDVSFHFHQSISLLESLSRIRVLSLNYFITLFTTLLPRFFPPSISTMSDHSSTKPSKSHDSPDHFFCSLEMYRRLCNSWVSVIQQYESELTPQRSTHQQPMPPYGPKKASEKKDEFGSSGCEHSIIEQHAKKEFISDELKVIRSINDTIKAMLLEFLSNFDFDCNKIQQKSKSSDMIDHLSTILSVVVYIGQLWDVPNPRTTKHYSSPKSQYFSLILAPTSTKQLVLLIVKR